MTREDLIDKAAESYTDEDLCGADINEEYVHTSFKVGANWAFSQSDELVGELMKALEKVVKRNDIEAAVLDYYGDCAMALAKARGIMGEKE